MSKFDVNQYFDKLQEVSSSDKREELAKAFLQKAESLKQINQETQQDIAMRQSYENSWVGKAGLNPNSAAGIGLNTLANVIDGTINVAKTITTTPHAVRMLMDTATHADIPVSVQEAYQRYTQGKASKEDMALINDDPQHGMIKGILDTPESYKSMLDRRMGIISDSKAVRDTLDSSSIVFQGHQENVTNSLNSGFKDAVDQYNKGEIAKAIVTGLKTIGNTVVDNPIGVTQYIANNAPQLAAAVLGGAPMMALTNGAYAADELAKGFEAAKDHGALPTKTETGIMALKAASLAAAETLGDKLVMGAGIAGKAVPGEIAAATRKGLSAVVDHNPLTRTLAHTVEGAIGEFATETYQTAVEDNIEGKAFNPVDALTGGAIGAMVGGHTSGGMRVLQELTGNTEHAVEKKQQAAEKVNDQVQAIQTGDVTNLLDPKHPSYSPVNAIAALHGNSMLDTATPDTQKANLDKANEIVTGLEQAKEKAQQAYESVSPETVDQLREQTAQVQEAIQNTDPADTSRVQQLKELLSSAQENLTDTIKAAKNAADYKLKFNKMDEQLQAAQAAVTRFHQELQPRELNTEEATAAINTPVDAANAQDKSQLTDGLINLSMAIPERLSATDATTLADTADNGLTDAQRSYLRAFSEARQAENSAKNDNDVNNDIMFGSKKNLGLSQYRARITAALASGNQATADYQMQLLQKLTDSHTNKAEALSQALDKGVGTQVLRNTDGSWFVSPTRVSEADRKKNGGFTVSSKGMVDSIGKEAVAIQAVLKEMQAAYALKFNNEVQGVSDVSNVPQGQTVQSNQSPTQEGQVPTAGTPVQTEASGTEVGDAGSNTQGSTTVSSSTTTTKGNTYENSSNQSTVENSNEGQRQGQNSQQERLLSNTQEAPASTVDTKSTVEVGDTNTQLQSNEAVKDSTSTVSKSDGTITQIGDKASEDASFNEKRFGNFFTQIASKASDASTRPLTAVKDFVSKVFNGEANVEDFLKEKNLTEQQTTALQTFFNKAKEWSSQIAANLVIPHNQKFAYDHPMYYLTHVMEEKGVKKADIDENIKTAMTAAAFAYVADQSAKPRFNDPETINRMLGKQTDSPVGFSEMAQEFLSDVGTYQPVVVDSVGMKVMDALGLKALDNAPQDIVAKMRTALGAYTLKLLEDKGIVVRTAVNGQVIQTLRNVGVPENKQVNDPDASKKPHYFYKLDESKSKEISDAMKGSGNVVQKLFGVEPGVSTPALNPFDKVQTKSDTGMGVPKLVQKVFEQQQTKDAWYINEAPFKLLGKFSREDALALCGVVDVTEENTHIVNEKSRTAKNDGLIRNFDNFMEFVGEHILTSDKKFNQEFYYHPDMWKMQRAGLSNNVANPQTDKIARALVAPKEWNTIVQTNDVDGFLLRVAEGLGKKTEQGQVQISVDFVKAKMQEPMYVEAIAAIQAQEPTPEQLQAIKKATLEGGEKLHTFIALIAYAAYDSALKEGKTEFTTNLMGEVDGVANGSSLNHMLYGAADSVEELKEKAERGGMYTADSSAQQYNEWYGGTNRDTYQHNAMLADQAINDLMASNPTTAKLINAIWATSKVPVENGVVTKGGRNLLKTALNPLNYGAGFTSIRANMQDAYIKGIYAQIEEFSKLYHENPSKYSEIELKAFVENLNVLLKDSKAPLIPVGKSIQDYMNYKLNTAQERALSNAYDGLIGQTVTSTIEQTFAPLLDKTRLLVKTANASYQLYNAVYQAERKAMIKELGIPMTVRNGVEMPLHDLTAAQEKELRKKVDSITPMMHTGMSQDDGDIHHGLLMLSRDRSISTDPNYTSTVKFGTKTGDNTSSMTVRAYTTQDSSPSVMPISASTQSLDSKIMKTTQEGRNILNAHDAAGASVGILPDVAHSLNAATFDSLLNYSPMKAAFDGAIRTINGLIEMHSKGTLSQEAINALKDVTGKKAQWAVILVETFNQAQLAEYHKLSVMSQLTSMDQYAFAKGNYEVTDANRAEAAKRLEALSNDMPEKDRQAINTLLGIIEGKHVAMPEITVSQAGFWGKQGTSLVKSDDRLVSFFKGKTEVGAHDVINRLSTIIQNEPVTEGRNFNLALLKQLKAQVSKDTKVIYVTTDTPISLAPNGVAANSRGWFNIGTGNIYALSPEFVNSGLTVEMLLHELTHATLHEAINHPTAKNKEYVDGLNRLLDKVKRSIPEDLKTKYAEALSNVHEFTAYGMTSEAFRNDVLTQVQVSVKGTGGFKQAIRSFVETITNILFANSTDRMATAMDAMIRNVAGIYNEQSSTQADSKSTQNLSMASPTDTYSTMEIFNALDTGAVSPVFNEHMKDLLNGIVEKLHGPFGALKNDMQKNAAGNAMAVWLKALSTGKAPFASSIVASGFAASAQEDFVMQQVELTVKAAIDEGNATTKLSYKALTDLYMEAYKTLKPSDFASQADYDFVFKMEANNGDKSDYIARFAALGLGHEGFNKLLQRPSSVKINNAPTTFGERLTSIFQSILAFFADKITKTYSGQPMDSKLQSLVSNLVDIEAKKQETLRKNVRDASFIQPIEDKVKEFSDDLRQKISDITRSSYIKTSQNGYLRGAAGAINIITNNRVGQVMDLLRSKSTNPYGIIHKMMQEVSGYTPDSQAFIRATKETERIREAISETVGNFVLNSFAGNGAQLTKQEKASISATFMRLGMHNLQGHFTLEEMHQLMTDSKYLEQAIADYSNNLNTKVKSKQIEAANVLGMYRATGTVKGMLMMNAHNITRMLGTPYSQHITEQEAQQQEEHIKVLATLFGLKYSGHKMIAAQVLHQENQRSDGNGVDFLMAFHKVQEQEALDKAFNNNPVLMMHGYVPEVMNPSTALKFADEVEGKDLIAQGYSKMVRELVTDSADPESQVKKHIYVKRDGNLNAWNSGAISLMNPRAKGSTKHDGFLNVNTITGLENSITNATVLQDKVGLMNAGLPPARDLTQSNENHLAPVYNEKGDIVNWRYMMSEANKDSLMERNNDFAHLMGRLAGTTAFKESSKVQNATIVQALHDDYTKNQAKNPTMYGLNVSANTSDRLGRELWNMLGHETQKEIQRVWGRDGMTIKGEDADLLFGYRKLSISNFLTKDPVELAGLSKLMRNAFNTMLSANGYSPKEASNLAKRWGTYLLRGEHAWQEIVREAKDNIVIKTGVVFLGNVWSNESLLTLSGVPLRGRMNHHLAAYNGATSYQKDSARLMHLEAMLATGKTNGNDVDIKREIVMLKDAIERNPVTPLVKAGLMPTIVEDLSQDDPYSYKSMMARKLQKVADATPNMVKEVAKQVYMSHDTKTYQIMNRMTQLSDFMARYTMYQHMMSQEGMTHEEAITKASEAFVNYDIPMHRTMQYLDDMGVIPFTKYFLRIQKPLMDVAKENPARVLMTVLLNKFINLGPTVLDSSFIHHVGFNPIKYGAFEYPHAIGQIATIHESMALLK